LLSSCYQAAATVLHGSGDGLHCVELSTSECSVVVVATANSHICLNGLVRGSMHSPILLYELSWFGS